MKYGEVVRIWPLSRGTGNIMIPISGTCGSRTRVACRGGPPTGSSGFAPSISPRERRRPRHPGLPLPHLSPWGIVASSIRVLLALAALISMSVPSVALPIQPVSAFFVPQSPKALHAPLPTRLPDRPGLGPELPTPIRVDRFLPLLSNYAPEAALYLQSVAKLVTHSAKFWNFLDERRTTAKKNNVCQISPRPPNQC